MQDFVRVGIADSAEQTWIGQRSLKCVILSCECRPELIEIGREEKLERIIGRLP